MQGLMTLHKRDREHELIKHIHAIDLYGKGGWVINPAPVLLSELKLHQSCEIRNTLFSCQI